MHRRAPEIVDEDIRQRRMRPQVAVLFDRADIIEHEVALTAIVVANSASGDHDRA